MVEQSGRELSSTVPTTRTCDGKIQERKVVTDIRINPFFHPQPLQSGPSLNSPKYLRGKTIRLPSRVASTCGLMPINQKILIAEQHSSDNALRNEVSSQYRIYVLRRDGQRDNVVSSID